MPYYYDYSYPFAEPWRTTYVPRHFPEKHYPWEHFCHAIGHGISNVADNVIHPFAPEQPINNPWVDIRESKNNYYVDVELPGLENKDNLKIKWLNARTFLVETKIERPEIEEQETTSEEADNGTTATNPAREDHGHSNSDYKDRSKIDEEDHTTRTDVALTVHERRLGLFVRAFSFPTDVCHEKLEANLHVGLLRIKVPKNVVDVVKSEHKEIEVKHSGA
jgi:HSP20 family molecular chaperone IbpA